MPLHFLCSKCCQIDFKPVGLVTEMKCTHMLHDTFVELEESADTGCHLCTLILSTLILRQGASDTWKRKKFGQIRVGCMKTLSGHLCLGVSWNDFTQVILRISNFASGPTNKYGPSAPENRGDDPRVGLLAWTVSSPEQPCHCRRYPGEYFITLPDEHTRDMTLLDSHRSLDGNSYKCLTYHAGQFFEVRERKHDRWLVRSAKSTSWKPAIAKCTTEVNAELLNSVRVPVGWIEAKRTRFSPDDTINEDPASVSIFSHISKWMSICTAEHKTCRRELLAMMPRRVIDVGPVEGSEHPRLTTTDNIQDNYITLSYRWGTAFPLTTTLKTLEVHSEGIPLDYFPKTLRDAILVTRKLGIKYLWVDAICIVQDDPEDWRQQASQMHNIYYSAWLNISADCATDSNSGFLSRRNSLEIRSCQLPSHGLMIHPSMPSIFTVIDKGGLSERGWTLQERIFSNRIVHWSHLEVGWECNEMHASERHDKGFAKHIWPGKEIRKRLLYDKDPDDILHSVVQGESEPSVVFAVDAAHEAWYRLVEEYSARLLTYPDKDKLSALSGIADAFYAKYSMILGPKKSAYISGLWRGDLARGLGWSIYNGQWWRRSKGLPTIPMCDLEDPSTWKYRAPSFSWTAFDEVVAWRGSVTSEGEKVLHEYDVEVLDSQSIVTDRNSDSWGRAERSWIKLRGIVCGNDLMDTTSSRAVYPDPDSLHVIEDDAFYPQMRWIRLTVTQLVRERYSKWLMIFPTGNAENEYRRIGVWDLVCNDFSLEQDMEKTTIKLV